MTGMRLHFETLDLALTRPLVVAGHTLTTRSIVRVTCTDSMGRTGCGDIAPLSGLHKETFDQVLAQVEALAKGRTTL